ncbi:hypothetical protein SDC9_56946 [bioreactor metagenome]|uniref:Uncharacterized protein n=1 Tax=bioreactor metagenome TaxID=1076179 RepID=A0A644X8Z6_9ZZZZ
MRCLLCLAAESLVKPAADEFAQALGPDADFLRRNPAEADPHAVVSHAVALDEEALPRHVGHPHVGRGQRFCQQAGGVDASGKPGPGEEPPVGEGPHRSLREVCVDGLDHDVPPLPVEIADHPVVGRVVPPLEELGADDLGQHGRVGVGGRLGVEELCRDFLRREDVAQPAAGGEDLGEAVGEDGVPRGVEGLDGGQVRAAVADVPVGVVLEDDGVVPAAEFGHFLSPFEGEGAAGGILEGGDDVDHLRPVLPDLGLQILGDHAVLVHGDADAPGLEHLEDLHAVDEGGRLHQNDVAGVDEELAEEVHTLQAAAGDDNSAGVGLHALGGEEFAHHDFTEVRQAHDAAVLEGLHSPAVPGDHLVRYLPDDVDGQGFPGRGSPSEGDNAGIVHGAEEAPDDRGRFFHGFHSLGEDCHDAPPFLGQTGNPFTARIVSFRGEGYSVIPSAGIAGVNLLRTRIEVPPRSARSGRQG